MKLLCKVVLIIRLKKYLVEFKPQPELCPILLHKTMKSSINKYLITSIPTCHFFLYKYSLGHY